MSLGIALSSTVGLRRPVPGGDDVDRRRRILGIALSCTVGLQLAPDELDVGPEARLGISLSIRWDCDLVLKVISVTRPWSLELP